MPASQDFFINMVLTAWNSQLKRITKLLDGLSDEQFGADIAPGRNSGTYILGHLTAVNDYLFPILGLGERLYPELEAVFLINPDKSGLVKPSVIELLIYWLKVSQQLTARFDELSTENWFSSHMTISEDDFIREPHRNKLNIVINRTNHLSYHVGQLVLLHDA